MGIFFNKEKLSLLFQLFMYWSVSFIFVCMSFCFPSLPGQEEFRKAKDKTKYHLKKMIHKESPNFLQYPVKPEGLVKQQKG